MPRDAGSASLIASLRFSPDDLDPAIDPCDDLDGHVNARWRARTVIPADRGCWDSFSVVAEATLLAQRAIAEDATAAVGSTSLSGHVDATFDAARIVGALWRTGMNGDSASDGDDVACLLADLDAIASRAAIVSCLDRAHARGEELLWSIHVVPDIAAPDQRQLRIAPATGLLPRADLVDATGPATHRRRLCAAYCAGLLRRAGRAPHAARRDAQLALALDAELAQQRPAETQRDVAALHRPLPFDNARRAMVPLSIDGCLAAAGMEPPPTLSLPAPAYHATVARLLASAPLAQWQAWLRVRVLDAAAAELPSTFRAWHHRFHGRALRGMRVQPLRWKQVLAAIDRAAPDAMAQLYVARHVSADTAPRMRALFESLRDALRARIAAADWLGSVARRSAIGKIDAMRARLVAPVRWPDWSEVDLGAAGFHASLRTLRAHALRRRLRTLHAGTSADTIDAISSQADDWSMPAHRVNARYDPQANCIEVPAGILQPPFFDPQASRASQYGAIGAVMAHEMSHGVDDQGRRFDADGRLGEGWPAEDVAGFDRRADAVAAWFDAMPDGVGGWVDGRRTLGENLADITGLAVAWDAYRTDRAEGAWDGQVEAQESSGAMPLAPVDADADAQGVFIAWAAIWRQLLTPAEAQRRAALDHHAPAALRATVAPAALDGFWPAFDGRRSADARGVPRVW